MLVVSELVVVAVFSVDRSWLVDVVDIGSVVGGVVDVRGARSLVAGVFVDVSSRS